MCDDLFGFGLDLDGDGKVSFDESYLAYRIGKDIIDRNNADDTDDTGDFDDFGDDI